MPWTLSPLETLWCATALAAGYAVRGVAGFGSGIVATPLLAFVLPMTTTAPLITVVGFLVSTRQALRDWRLIQWKAVLSFAPGALVGVPLGLWAVKTADQTMLSRILGAYVVTYALYSLFGERLLGRAPTMPRWMVHPIGVAGGVISTLFGGLAGPLYVTYFDSQRLAKGAFRVTVSTTLLTLAMVRSAGYLAAGLFRAEDLVLIAAALLPVAVGTAAGEWVHDHIEQQAFRRGIGALLVLSGTALLLR